MLQISDSGSIRLTKADSVTLDITLTDSSGTAYALQEGDTVTMHISNGEDDYDISADSYNANVAQVVLDSEFTAQLSGAYTYDVVIVFATEEQYTLINPSSLVVTEGVD